MSITTPIQYRRKVVVRFEEGTGRTEQAHKDEVDIHSIMARYRKTGLISHVSWI